MYTQLSKSGRSKKYVMGGIAHLVLLLITSPVWSATGAATGLMSGSGWKGFGGALSACFVLSFGVLGCALGMSKVGFAALEGMARQPEVYNRLFTTMLIGMALIEAICLYCLVVSLILIH